MGRRGYRVEGGVGAMGAVKGAQVDEEKEVDAIRGEIWDVRNGGV